MSRKNFTKISFWFSLGTLLLVSCGPSTSSNQSTEGSASKDISSQPLLPVTDDRNLDDFAYTLNSLTGTDAFGRTFKATKKENGKEVGLFYFLWQGAHENGIYDITQLLKDSPDSPLDPNGSSASPNGVFHKWGKPLYGYYNSADPFVIARHLELFVQAGIDYLVFDTTNSVTYNNVVIALSNIFLTYQKQGWKVPKLAFYCNSSSSKTVETIYGFYYRDHPEFKSLWYTIDNKPMMVANTADFTNEQYYQSQQWNRYLIRDPYFLKLAYEKYKEIRPTVIEDIIKEGGWLDQYEAEMTEAGVANDKRWSSTYDAYGGEKYPAAMDTRRSFIEERVDWLDEQFASLDTYIESTGYYVPSVEVKVINVSYEDGQVVLEGKTTNKEAKKLMFQINGTKIVTAEIGEDGKGSVTVPASELEAEGKNIVQLHACRESGTCIEGVSNYKEF